MSIRRQILLYLGLTVIFFLLSAASLYFVHRFFSGGNIRFPVELLSSSVIFLLLIMLILYFIFDSLRLYCVIRAVGQDVSFLYIIKLVFVNILISNVTPFAVGGGFVQVYFMQKKGMQIGTATAATSIRTLLAALVLFTLAPVIIWIQPEKFVMFMHKNILYGITFISILYITVFLLLLLRIKIFKQILFRTLLILNRFKLVNNRRVRKVYGRLSNELTVFSNGFNRFIRNNPLWSFLSVISTVMFLLSLFSFSAVLLSIMGYSIPVITVLTLQVVVTFFMYFAPTPGASGIAEGGFGLLFSQMVKPHDITSLIFTWRFLTIYIGMILGIAVLAGELFTKSKQPGL